MGASEFSDSAGMSLAASSGCTVKGLSIRYIFAAIAVEPTALEINVNILNTTVFAEAGIVRRLSDYHLGDMVGTHGNDDFLSKVCSHPTAFLFPKACAFFAPE